ncbi:hypothetical protein QBC40DRAFT_174204 [Triangularia verruculosa]|uniref:Uncharacterized protein n=1 Tax=Triangularia verruculosa TaxID=2587418 RepID=A0AAN6XGN4_9PEZI|nr:hypothetical protein QBC40DRAFT_174204 [Triangularia verruculosa]
MPDVEDVQDAIATITRLRMITSRRQSTYLEQSNRLRTLLNAIFHQFGFSNDTATQAMTGPVRAGDYTMLVAGWTYRQLIKLAESNRRLENAMNDTHPAIDRYSMDQLRSWSTRLSSPDLSEETLQKIANKTIPIPMAFQVRWDALNKEINTIERRIRRVEVTPAEAGVASLIAGEEDELTSSDEEATEDENLEDD